MQAEISIYNLITQITNLSGDSPKQMMVDALIVGLQLGRHAAQINADQIDQILDSLRSLYGMIEAGMIESRRKGELYDQFFSNLNQSLTKTIQQEINAALNASIRMKQSNNGHNDKYLEELRKEEMSMMQFQTQKQKLDDESLLLAKKLQEEYEIEEKKLKQQRQQEEAPQDCQICFDKLELDQSWPLSLCGHMFHRDCLKESFSVKIKDREFPLVCPNCLKETHQIDLLETLDDAQMDLYQEYTLSQYIDMHSDEMSWCPTPDCNYAFMFEKDEFELHCPKCRKHYCLNCRVEYHKNQSCQEYRISNSFDKNDEKFLKFVKGRKFKQCPKCKFWVEKNQVKTILTKKQGCNHMTCRCKYEFCYVCGGKYMECACVQKMQERMQAQRDRMQDPGPRKRGARGARGARGRGR